MVMYQVHHQHAGSFCANVGDSQPAGSSSADTDGPMRDISAQSRSSPGRMSGKRYDRMGEDVYASPCQNVFDERMKKSWPWSNWWEAQEDSIKQDETTSEPPPLAHIGHWSEHSQW